jgi:Flp pilus assembly protein TadB
MKLRFPGSGTTRQAAIPKRPYRDSALLYALLALVVLGFAMLTGSDLGRALVIAVAFFVLATAWSWWRFSRRLAEEKRR